MGAALLHDVTQHDARRHHAEAGPRSTSARDGENQQEQDAGVLVRHPPQPVPRPAHRRPADGVDDVIATTSPAHDVIVTPTLYDVIEPSRIYCVIITLTIDDVVRLPRRILSCHATTQQGNHHYNIGNTF